MARLLQVFFVLFFTALAARHEERQRGEQGGPWHVVHLRPSGEAVRHGVSSEAVAVPATLQRRGRDRGYREAAKERFERYRRQVRTAVMSAGPTKAEVLKATGVKHNSQGDLYALISASATSLLLLVVTLGIFSFCLRPYFPLVYQNNVLEGKLPSIDKDSEMWKEPFGWMSVAFWTTPDEAVPLVGLDNAMLLEYIGFARQLLLLTGLPIVFVLMPLHASLGHRAQEALSRFGVENVDAGSSLFWAHTALVYYVTIGTQELIITYKKAFVIRRLLWLQTMPDIRATTVLVEEIPRRYRSDEQLRHYFASLFGDDVVCSAHMVKQTRTLRSYCADLDRFNGELVEANFKLDRSGKRSLHTVLELHPGSLATLGTKVDAIDYFEELRARTLDKIRVERRRVLDEVEEGNSAIFTRAGFVTFRSRRDATIALMVTGTEDSMEFVMSVPPEPSDVIYEDFMYPKRTEVLSEVVGVCLIAGVFFGFVPIVVTLSSLSNLEALKAYFPSVDTICERYPALQAILEGVLSTFAVQVVMVFLPTALLFILSKCFSVKSHTWLQVRLQTVSFWFHLLFVVLITAVGNSLLATLQKLLDRPNTIFELLAETLPNATHFYLNLAVLGTGSYGLELLRYSNLAKFLGWRLMRPESHARELSEPEDQDFHGIGSRSVRSTIWVVIALVYGSLCPLITVAVFINCCVCQVVMTYLIVIAETRKADLGGVFFEQQLQHTYSGLFIYVVLMSGVLHVRGPRIQGIAQLSAGTLLAPLFIVMYVRHRAFLALRWEVLPFEAACDAKPVQKQATSRNTYDQPELVEEEAAASSQASPFRIGAAVAEAEKRRRSASSMAASSSAEGHAGAEPPAL